MSFDPDQCMKIRATGKCDEGWWFFSSKNPVIVSGLQETMGEARDKYEENLKSYLEKRWGILPEQVIRYETKTRAVSVWFVEKEDLHTARVNPEDLRTTITYCIQEQKNRTLDEYLSGEESETIIKAANLDDAGKIVDTITKITEIAEETGLSPETIFNTAMAELKRQKSAKSVFETALPELEKLGEEQSFTVSLHKGTDPAGGEA